MEGGATEKQNIKLKNWKRKNLSTQKGEGGGKKEGKIQPPKAKRGLWGLKKG